CDRYSWGCRSERLALSSELVKQVGVPMIHIDISFCCLLLRFDLFQQTTLFDTGDPWLWYNLLLPFVFYLLDDIANLVFGLVLYRLKRHIILISRYFDTAFQPPDL